MGRTLLQLRLDDEKELSRKKKKQEAVTCIQLLCCMKSKIQQDLFEEQREIYEVEDYQQKQEEIPDEFETFNFEKML